MDTSSNSIENDLKDVSIGSNISNIFGSTEDLHSSNIDIQNCIVQDVLLLWIKYKLPIKAFNDLIKIIKNIPDIGNELRRSLNVNFEQCLRSALESNEVVLYKKCNSCHGYQGKKNSSKQKRGDVRALSNKVAKYELLYIH